MIINHLRQSYTFNSLCICGIINFVIFFISIAIITITIILLNSPEPILGIAIIIHFIGLIDTIIFLFAILFAIFEYVCAIQIKNKSLIANKIVKAFQIIGIMFF